MKWPETLTLIRHDESAYNRMKKTREAHPLYQAFKKAYDQKPESAETQRLAIEVVEQFALTVGDHSTPLAQNAGWQAEKMATQLQTLISLPTVIFVSPYQRTHQTLQHMLKTWPALVEVPIIEEERIREQDRGLTLIYNDWRVFAALHPEQKKLKDLEGDYWYRLPQGENVPDVRERLRSWLGTLIRDYSETHVLAVTHHLAILSLRANLERLDAAEFIRLDKEEKPINCGVTIYRGDSTQGRDGKLILDVYNAKLY